MSQAATTLTAVLDERASAAPDRPLLTFLDDAGRETTLCRSALRDRAQTLAAHLVARGLRGKRALLLHAPGLDFVVALWGCLYAGVVAVPAYPPDPTRLERTMPRLLALVRNADVAIVLTQSTIAAMTSLLPKGSGLDELPWLATDRALPDERGPLPVQQAQRLALIQYTSGSTGSPRGVMLSHHDLLANVETYNRFLGDAGDTAVMWLPLYHDMGLVGGILSSAHEGRHCVFLSSMAFLRRPLHWLEAMSRHRATYTGGPSFAFDLAVRKTTTAQRAALDLSSMRRICVGAEPTRPRTLRRFLDAFAPAGLRPDVFRPCYGLAETALFVCGGGADDPIRFERIDREQAQAGRVRFLADHEGDRPARELVGHGPFPPEHTILVVDPESRQVVSDAHIGEVWVAGPGVAAGYWRAPEATHATFEAYTACGQGPLLRTGDLGFVDRGQLFITGRLKDLIIIRGRNLHPEDLEATIETAHPRLRPGCIAAFHVEDGDAERLVVVQELQPGPADEELAAVADACWRAVGDAVAHAHGVALDTLCLLPPRTILKTSSGKVRRRACRERYLDGSLEVLTRRDRSPATACPQPGEIPRDVDAIADWLVRWIAQRTQRPPEQIDRDATITNMGIDSLGFATLTFDIEESFDLVITDVHKLSGNLQSIHQLARTLATEIDARAPSGAGR